MREKPDTREIVYDMRSQGLSGIVGRKDLMKYTGRGKDWVAARFPNIGDGISIVSAARVLGGLTNDAG